MGAPGGSEASTERSSALACCFGQGSKWGPEVGYRRLLSGLLLQAFLTRRRSRLRLFLKGLFACCCLNCCRYLATGSSAGVVNIYGRDQFQTGAALSSKAGLLRPLAPTPLREIMNLTTTVDTLAFSPDSQMLAMASRMKKDAMRLVHLPSCTVFSNWPTGRSPLHYVHSLAFSPNGGFLAVGNARGRVLLYRLHHYKDV